MSKTGESERERERATGVLREIERDNRWFSIILTILLTQDCW